MGKEQKTSIDLSSFTKRDYYSPDKRKAYITSLIPLPEDVSQETFTEFISEATSDADLVGDFFERFEPMGLTPATKMGKIVQLIDFEDRVERKLNNGDSDNAYELSMIIAQAQRVKTGLADEIFGTERGWRIVNELSAAFLAHNKTNSRAMKGFDLDVRMEIRNERLGRVLQDLERKNPLTFKSK